MEDHRIEILGQKIPVPKTWQELAFWVALFAVLALGMVIVLMRASQGAIDRSVEGIGAYFFKNTPQPQDSKSKLPIVDPAKTENIPTKQIQFWTPSIHTKDDLTQKGKVPLEPKDEWQDIAKDGDKKPQEFGDKLMRDMHASGFRRYEVYGHGSTRDKRGWWWVGTFDSKFDENDLLRAYVNHWYRSETKHPIYLEV